MSNYNIGPRIGIEGEAQFRAQISRINSEYRSMASYTEAVSKAMEKQGKTQSLLESKANGLRQQIDLQQRAYKQYADALEKVKGLEGDHSSEITRYEGALLHVRNEVDRLSKELVDTVDDMEKLAQGIEDVDEAADGAGKEMLDFGDALKAGVASGAILNAAEKIGEMLLDLGRDAVEAAAEVKASNSQFAQAFGELESTARSALERISKDTGVAVTRLQEAYTGLFAFTKSVGGDSATALNIAQRAMKAAADSAAYYDRSIEDATESLQSFLKGNYANDAALGIAATETTRNAKANELYAKSFKELTEAQKVDTLLAMVEAGNAASGALGQAAREADEWNNVTGELSEAWRQMLAVLGGPVLQSLTPMIQGITQGLKDLTAVASWQELRSGVEGFRESIAAAETALADSNAEIAATAGLAEQYVRRLQELETAGLNTAESQREYKQVVELLNALMPELGLTINENTGRLDQNTASIEANIRSLRKQAEQQAKMVYYKKIIDEYSEAYEQQYAAEQRLIELQEQERVLLSQGADDTRRYTEEMLSSTSGMSAMGDSLSGLNLELSNNRAEQVALQNELAVLNGELAENQAKLDAASAGYADLVSQSGEARTAATEQAEAQQALADAYEASTAEARESIDSQIGLWDKLETKSELSTAQILKRWQIQQQAFSNYAENLRKATAMGLDEALVQQLSDGSEQSMLILAELVSGTEQDVAKINAAFRGLSESKGNAATAMAEVSDVVQDALDDMADYAESSGADIIDGAVRGILDNTPRYKSALEGLAKAGQGAYLHQWEVHSPSRWMRDISDYIVDGGVDQVEARIRDMESAMTNLARAGQRAYRREQLEVADAYPSLIAGAPGYSTSTVTNTRQVAYGGISININTQPGQDAQDIADMVILKLTAQLGQEEAAF